MDRASSLRASRESGDLPPANRTLFRTLTGRNSSDSPIEEPSGPLGLTTLHKPTHGVVADIVFVHGLGGGSRKTWTKGVDKSTFWPEEWLPTDSDFRDVRIHTFGYDSKWVKGSILNIHDFAQSLLQWVIDCPDIAQNAEVPLVFVCHSMGGLVAKCAYILSRRSQQYGRVGSSLRAIVFLATPHRGADLADTLSKILHLSSGARPFVEDLMPSSKAIQSINEDFPRYSDSLQLRSFYETLPTRMLNSIIVRKESAILGYPNERPSYLDADHRNVCKFDSRNSTNYRAVRNALSGLLTSLRKGFGVSARNSFQEQQQAINTALGIHDPPEDDYLRADATKVRGSCEWISDRHAFNEWRHEGHPHIYWLAAKPGAGKSVLCGHVIKLLREDNVRSSFFFFTHTDKLKSLLGTFLRSVAWQMASADNTISDMMAKVCKREPELMNADHRTVWRKLFVECIFKCRPDRPHYWIVDALDECTNDKDLATYVVQAAATGSFRILVTSRTTFDHYGIERGLQSQMYVDQISEETTNSDIELYLKEQQRSESTKVTHYAVETLLSKADGCFLWTTLALQELRQGLTRARISEILAEVPSDMDQLYNRIVRSIYEYAREKAMINAILEWTTCATRPLTTAELNEALKLDLDDEIDGDVKRFIEHNFGQLVVTDRMDRVRMVHSTAKDFLFSDKVGPEYRFKRADGHRRIAMACLKCLAGPDFGGPRPRRLSVRQVSVEPGAFVSYAALALFEHIAFVHSEDDEFVASLVRFLKSPNVLSWIEHIAKNSALTRLVQAGLALRNFVARRAERMVPFGNSSKENLLLDQWATDMVRLVTKFGTYLRQSPSSILSLVPPFCPAESAIKNQFASSNRAISVTGLKATAWDDCVSTIIQNDPINAVASVTGLLAIGSQSGDVILYEESVYQKDKTLSHGEPVKWVLFGDVEPVIVAVGLNRISVWSAQSWERIWTTEHQGQILSLALDDNDNFLIATCRSNEIFEWDMSDGSRQETRSWLDDDLEESVKLFRRPAVTAISADRGLLAIAYRGEDITVWNLELSSTHDIFGRREGARGATATPRRGVSTARSMIFSNAPGDTRLLVASYNDGVMQLFDTEKGTLMATTFANAHNLASSNNGLTLACGGSDGVIQILEFETLKLLYRIQAVQTNIRQLVFSADDRRLLCVQNRYCYIWDPPVLVRQNVEEGSDTVSISTGPQDATAMDPISFTAITSIAMSESGRHAFCGREDGSICLQQTVQARDTMVLLHHARNVEVKFVEWNPTSLVLATVDVSSRVLVHRLTATRSGGFECGDCILDIRVRDAIVQVLLSRDARHLLISTEHEDLLFSLQLTSPSLGATNESPVKTRFSATRRMHKWCTHPHNTNQLILIFASSAHIFDWETLEELSPSGGVRMLNMVDDSMPVTSVLPCFDDEFIAITISDSNSSQAQSEVLFYPTCDFAPESPVLEADSTFDSLASQVHMLIGTVKAQRLVFLDHEGWICSALTAGGFHIDRYDRHHFLPADWLSAADRLRLEVCAKDGSMLFVRRDELICIRKGLDHVDPRQNKAFSKRPSLKGNTLSGNSIQEGKEDQSGSLPATGGAHELSERLKRARSSSGQPTDSTHLH